MQVRGRPLHFGVQLQAQSTTWTDYLQAVRTTEDLGFGSIWTFDHLLPFSGTDDRAAFETLTTLGALAVTTVRVRFGALVNGVIYREPAVLAKSAAQIDEMSGGRLEFALGAAWAEREFRAYGMPFPPLRERYARLDEALDLIKLLWSQHRTTFRGRYYHVVEAPCEPKPVQSPHPPITIGGVGLGSLRVAAKHASRLNLVGSPEKCAECAAKLREICAGIGRNFDDIELSAHPTLVLAPSGSEAEIIAERMSTLAFADASTVKNSWLVGGPAEVTKRIRQYMVAGISHFVFAVGFPFDSRGLRLLRQEVVPALDTPTLETLSG